MTLDQSIVIIVGDVSTTFTPADSPVRLGRAEAELIVAHPSVSKSHATLEYADGRWLLTDHSTHGTYVDGARVSKVTVDRDLTVWLADPQTGARIELHPSIPPTLDAASPDQPARQPDEQLGPETLRAPGGVTLPPPVGEVLRVTYPAGTTRELAPGTQLIVGRGTDADLQTTQTNEFVSRRHARVFFDGKVWQLEDLGSRRGTYVDGVRIKKQKLAGQFDIWLGSPETGERIVVEAAGAHRRRLSPKVLLGAGVVLAVLIAGIALATRDGGGGGGLDNAAGNDVPRMKRATGLVIAVDQSGQAAKGSSTVICGDNLVLTNAHVAQPDAPGQGLLYGEAEPANKALYLAYPPADDPDGIVEVRYKAEVVTYDGYVDAAALRIVAKASGTYPKIVDGEAIRDAKSLQLPCAELPTPGALPSKTAVDVFGYPGVTGSTDEAKFFNVQQDADSNEVTSYAEDPVLEERYGWINLGRNTQPGNSGGLVARNNQIFGMPTRGDTESSQARPIDLARRVIDAARANKSGDLATYLTPLTGTEKFVADTRAPAGCPLRKLGKSDDTAVDFALTWTGVDAKAHVEIYIRSATKVLYTKELGRSQEGAGVLGTTKCLAFSGVPTDATKLIVYAGPNLEVHDSFAVKAT
ncbi:MAG: FHA domain-containing protein [Acidimicrobiales bacterium]